MDNFVDGRKQGIELIKKKESLKLIAYYCPAKVPTIGYGTTRYPDNTPVKIGDTCTQEQAQSWIESFVDRYLTPKIKKLVDDTTPPSVIAALYSLGYNYPKALTDDALPDLIENHNWGNINILNNPTGLAQIFYKYRFSDGKPILANRRIEEIKYYLSGIKNQPIAS